MKTSPTKRSLDLLRPDWLLVEVTEHWNPFARIRKDLFGFIDILCVRGNNLLAVQTTSAGNMSARFHKIASLPKAARWLDSPTRELHIHGWALRGPRGQRKRWVCRVVRVLFDGQAFRMEEVKP